MTPRATSIYNLHFDIVHGCQLRCVGCPNSILQPKIKRMPVARNWVFIEWLE